MKRALIVLSIGLCCAILTGAGQDKTKTKETKKLKVGDTAPEFVLKGHDGKTYKLSDYKGKRGVIVAWYPKALTGG